MIGIGGGVGSVARFLFQKLVHQFYPSVFPLGTFLINMVGCLAIGFIWGLANRSSAFSEKWQLFLMAGLCGGFTTFSGFGLESVSLIKEERWSLLIFYAGGSVILGIAATLLGIRLTK
mgnify:CR=1 FL=1